MSPEGSTLGFMNTVDIQLRFSDQGGAPSLEIRCAPESAVALSMWTVLESLGMKALSPYLIRKGERLIAHMKVASFDGFVDQASGAKLIEALRSCHADGAVLAPHTKQNGSHSRFPVPSRLASFTVSNPTRLPPTLHPEVPHRRAIHGRKPQELQS